MESRGQLVNDFMSDAPHIFVYMPTVDGERDMATGISGSGKDVLFMWAALSAQIAEAMHLSGLKELADEAEKSIMRSIIEDLKED